MAAVLFTFAQKKSTTMKQHTKDIIQYGSAVAMIASSITLAYASFVLLNFIHASVLTFVGEAVSFAAGVFGLGVYAHAKGAELDHRIQSLQQHMSRHEND